MNYRVCLVALIFSVSCVFSQTADVYYERVDKAVISDFGGRVASIELANNYRISGGRMYLEDCGRTTCYLKLRIAPGRPIDTRTIVGRVAEGDAEYVGAQIYETRMVPTPTYKTVQKNYTYSDNVSGIMETVFYNETVFDRYVDIPTLGWYALDYAELGAGRTYEIRLEYRKKNQLETVDLIPELNGKRIDGWAYWAGTAQIPYWSDGSDGIWINVSLNTTTPLQVLLNKTSTDLSNGTAVFPFFDDHNDGTIDSTIWNTSLEYSCPFSEANGILSFTCFNQGYGRLFSFATFGQNTSCVWRANLTSPNGDAWTNHGMFEYTGDQPSALFQLAGGYTEGRYATRDNGVWESVAYVENSSWKVYEVWRNGSANVVFYIDYTQRNINTVRIPSASIPFFMGTGWSSHSMGYNQDWVFCRNKTPTSEPTVSCADLNENQVLCNISTTVNLTGYQVRIPYASLNTTNLTVELGVFVYGDAPALQSISLNPAAIYKNTTVWCEVNYTDDGNTTFTAYQGLAINGTIIDGFNRTNASYANGTVWNETYDISNYTHGDEVSCWAYATDTNDPPLTSEINYTANITISDYVPIISNVQITNPIINGTDTTGTADFWDYENDSVNCRWEWFVNGIVAYSDVQSPCANTSTLGYTNYTVGDSVNFTVYANDSYGGEATPVSSATVVVSPTLVVNENIYTETQYESVNYFYAINFTIPSGDENVTVQLEYNDVNISASCTNTSTTYYCTLSDIPAPFVDANGTEKSGNWFIIYDSVIEGPQTTKNESFTVVVYYGVWATGINSSAKIAGGEPASVNVFYSNASGITATISGTSWLLGTSDSGSLACSAGVCSGSIATSPVSYTTIYQVEANLTLASSYWGTTQNRVVRIESSGTLTAGDARVSYSGSITNPNNANDSDWGTYATYGASGAYHLFNYTTSGIYYLQQLRTRFVSTYANTTVPEDCFDENILFKVLRDNTMFRVYCYNYSSENYSQIYSMTPGTTYYFYEQNVSYLLNNSYVKVMPFGLTDCSVGMPLFYFSCWNELDSNSENCTYDQTFILNTSAGGLVQTFTGSASSWTICFYPNTLVGNVSSTEEISGTGFDTRFFFMFPSPFNSSVSYNETRWVGDATDTKITFVYVKKAGVNVPGMYIYVQRLFVGENEFRTVGMGLTNDEGTAVVYLEPNDAFYKFIVVDENGDVVYTSSTQQVGCSASASFCSVTLNIETSVVDFWDYKDGISSACTFDNTTKIYSCSFVSGVSKYFQLDCYRWGQFGNKTLNCSENTTTQSGTLWCDLGDENTSGTFVCYLQSYSTGLILQEGTFSWTALASWGTTGIFIALVIVVVLALVGTTFGPSTTILFGYVGLIISWLFQFVHLDLSGLVGVGIVAGVLIYVVKY